MVAKELFEEISRPVSILIIYSTEEWRDMMWQELIAFGKENITEEEKFHYLELSFIFKYSFAHMTEIKGMKADYVITERSVPDYVSQPCLISHFYHDRKAPVLPE